jgi:hypothetical protein
MSNLRLFYGHQLPNIGHSCDPAVMTRKVTALLFLGRMLVAQQPPSPTPKTDPVPTFTQAEIQRLVNDAAAEFQKNQLQATQILARQFADEMKAAAKQGPAAMQRAAEANQKRTDAFNQDGRQLLNWGEASSSVLNQTHPGGFARNMLDSCEEGHKILTRNEAGVPVYIQVITEGGSAVIHTYPIGLPTDEVKPTHSTASDLCPALVRNAVKPGPARPATPQPVTGPPKAMRLCAAVCADLEWRNGRYEVLARDGQLATLFTVESFTPTSIVIKRMSLPVAGDYGLTAVYKGAFAEGSETAQGSVDFTWAGHRGFPHSASWTASWGSDLAQARPPAQKKPLERGDEEDAQARTAREQQMRTVSIGLMGAFTAFLGLGPTGTGGGFTGGDPAARIQQLQGKVDELETKCGIDTHNQTRACDQARAMREELSDAHAALDREIEALREQAARLEKDCSARVAGACDKLNRVKAKLESDIEVSLSGIF